MPTLPIVIETPPVSIPTRTHRPTRTPRTTPTLTPTPFVAGALRVMLSAEPGLPVAGQPVTFVVGLANRGEAAALDLTIDVTVPESTFIRAVDPRSGQTSRAGPLVRWYVPRLAPGGETALRLKGTVRAVTPGRLELCVMLLSAGAPLEYCAAFETSTGVLTPFGEPGEAEQPAFPTAATSGVLGAGDPPGRNPGWVLLALGLSALGLWFGMRSRRSRGEDSSG